MKKIRNIAFVALVLSVFALSSCTKLYEWNQPKEVAQEFSSIYPMSGEWWVVNRFDDGSGVLDDYYGVGHTKLYTYNTADESTTEMWVSDDANFWGVTFKTPVSLSATTFGGGADSLQSSYDHGAYEIKVLVNNGKIIKDGGKSFTGVTTDSIYFEIQYEGDPGVIYYTSGVRRTGFLEDEY